MRASHWERTPSEEEAYTVALPMVNLRRATFLATDVGEPSKTTAWLPTDFSVSPDGKVTALSNINNVDPEKQGGLHNALCGTLEAMIPMFSRCLADLRSGQQHVRILGEKQCEIDESTRPIDPFTEEPVRDYVEAEHEQEDLSEAEDEAGFGTWQPKLWRQWMLTKPFIDPVPEPYIAPKIGLGEGYSLNGKTIQVITKVAEM